MKSKTQNLKSSRRTSDRVMAVCCQLPPCGRRGFRCGDGSHGQFERISTVTAVSTSANLSGTPLGLDKPPGSRIQSYSIKVNYAPASGGAFPITFFSRAEITSSVTPTFGDSPSSAVSICCSNPFKTRPTD